MSNIPSGTQPPVKKPDHSRFVKAVRKFCFSNLKPASELNVQMQTSIKWKPQNPYIYQTQNASNQVDAKEVEVAQKKLEIEKDINSHNQTVEVLVNRAISVALQATRKEINCPKDSVILTDRKNSRPENKPIRISETKLTCANLNAASYSNSINVDINSNGIFKKVKSTPSISLIRKISSRSVRRRVKARRKRRRRIPKLKKFVNLSKMPTIPEEEEYISDSDGSEEDYNHLDGIDSIDIEEELRNINFSSDELRDLVMNVILTDNNNAALDQVQDTNSITKNELILLCLIVFYVITLNYIYF